MKPLSVREVEGIYLPLILVAKKHIVVKAWTKIWTDAKLFTLLKPLERTCVCVWQCVLAAANHILLWFPACCHGRQVCQIAEVANSFADPCPQLKSYLSVDYHCKDGRSRFCAQVNFIFFPSKVESHFLNPWRAACVCSFLSHLFNFPT